MAGKHQRIRIGLAWFICTAYLSCMCMSLLASSEKHPQLSLTTIIVDHYAPDTFMNPQGVPDGFSVELAQAVVDEHDVRRAAILRKAGNIVIPVVAGEDVRLEAEAAARQEVVVVIQDGRTFLWEEAFAKWKDE